MKDLRANRGRVPPLSAALGGLPPFLRKVFNKIGPGILATHSQIEGRDGALPLRTGMSAAVLLRARLRPFVCRGDVLPPTTIYRHLVLSFR